MDPIATARRAGILMHITSLPGPFGIGDLGPAARDFADRLQRSGQQLWQLLPVNPSAGGYSPYSAMSAMAGNDMLISPELLLKDGLLDRSALQKAVLPATGTVDFSKAYAVKTNLLEQAYRNYCKGNSGKLVKAYDRFCTAQAWWLNDFVQYRALTAYHKGKPWYEWKAKHRNDKAPAPGLDDIREKERWLQFIFDRQWQSLKQYCNKRGILLFGDMPIYMSYDSVDVWANRGSFKLDRAGNMLGVAGVPPDYFNENGQLWNMPVYNWPHLKKAQYRWWVDRIRRNLVWFDLLRLDHFRAFAGYWEVPAGAATAVDGAWQPGPGADLLQVLQTAFPAQPFVAEDLGQIDEAVLQLRDQFRWPGMKVLQFAFGDNMPVSEHIPHEYSPHYFVYTGTHDNNTTRGWWEEDLGPEDRDRLNTYAGQTVTQEEAPLVLGRMAYASVAHTAILPMQDVLALDGKARMNKPAEINGNWQWRMLPGQFNDTIMQRLKTWAQTYNRIRTNGDKHV
ncbi:4-alpha-glucanotransferase [Chitinophaga agrisoli]|uniref:4-alpha-glucanotransferase n=1 Tax=Chitinophaga agrisoli TaxID=2607653 RepID=A0A5B2VXT6_9BACT|nr:4-alpha-glucanotransferase [Chitinophaga agrisoli]KAA2243634.1 4-alpha-glucanotransferase [Chitinophaga agrisoli]